MPCRSTPSRGRPTIWTLLIKPDADDAQAVYSALGKFGAPLDGVTAEAFIVRDKFFRMGRAPVIVDILPEIEGVDFDRAWANRVEAVIDPATDLTAFFISSADLIAAKLAAGRPQDIADVSALRKAANQSNRDTSRGIEG
jgi:hypothetical protein